MLDRSVDARQENYPAAGLDVAETVRELSSRELAPLVSRIDSEGLYPESVMRAFGRAGAFAPMFRCFGSKELEATPGIEPGYTVLQTVA